MTNEEASKCFICGKEIQSDSVPRIEPNLDKIRTEDKEDHLVCAACGNIFTIVLKMIERTRDGYIL